MEFPFYHVAAFVISAVIVLVLTPLVRKIGIASGRVDMPGDRKVHSQPMVRLGGVAIFSGVLVALLVVWFTGGFLGADGLPLDPVTDHSIWGVTLGGVAFFAIGLLDDLFGLSAISRLIMQIIVASMAWYVGVDIAFLNLPWSETGITQLPDVISWVVTIFLVGGYGQCHQLD